MFTIETDEGALELGSSHEVEVNLDRLQEVVTPETAQLVTVERTREGTALSIGLGRNLSVLNFIGRDGNPPYFTSSGGSGAQGSITFWFGGHLSEYPLRNAIPIASARAAMRHFCETGQLSDDLQWEEG